MSKAIPYNDPLPSVIRALWAACLCVFLAIGGFPITSALSGQTEPIEPEGLNKADHERLYRETREVIQRWEEIKQLPPEELRPLRRELVINLMRIDPKQLPFDINLMSLPDAIEVLAKVAPDHYQRGTRIIASLKGAVWDVQVLRSPVLPEGAMGEDIYMVVEVDAFSGTILTPLVYPAAPAE